MVNNNNNTTDPERTATRRGLEDVESFPTAVLPNRKEFPTMKENPMYWKQLYEQFFEIHNEIQDPVPTVVIVENKPDDECASIVGSQNDDDCASKFASALTTPPNAKGPIPTAIVCDDDDDDPLVGVMAAQVLETSLLSQNDLPDEVLGLDDASQDSEDEDSVSKKRRTCLGAMYLVLKGLCQTMARGIPKFRRVKKQPKPSKPKRETRQDDEDDDDDTVVLAEAPSFSSADDDGPEVAAGGTKGEAAAMAAAGNEAEAATTAKVPDHNGMYKGDRLEDFWVNAALKESKAEADLQAKLAESTAVVTIVGSDDPDGAVLERIEKLTRQAHAKFNKGKIKAARSMYSDALSQIPPVGSYSVGVQNLLAKLYSSRAVTYYRTRDCAEALVDCNAALGWNPNHERTHLRKYRALKGLDRDAEAAFVLREAGQKFPNCPAIRTELRTIDAVYDSIIPRQTGCGCPLKQNPLVTDTPSEATTDKADKLLRQANAKFNRGKFQGAWILYTEAIEGLYQHHPEGHEALRPILARLYSNRAVVYYKTHDYASCLDDCNRCLAVVPEDSDDPKPYIRKARVLEALKRHGEALECLEEGCRKVPGSDRLKEDLEKARQRSKDDDEPQITLPTP